MGFLKVGTPLVWEKVEKIKTIIRLYGLLQFIHIFKCNNNREDTNLMFGDEIEYIILKNDETVKESSVLLCASDLIDAMMNLETNSEFLYGSHWTPEYASYIIEGTPSMPFKFDLNSSAFVEDCIRNRRSKLNDFLSSLNGVRAVTLPCFPNLLLENSYLMAKPASVEITNKMTNGMNNNGVANSQTVFAIKENNEMKKMHGEEQHNKKCEKIENTAEVVACTKNVDFKNVYTHKLKSIQKDNILKFKKKSATESEDKSSHLSTICFLDMEENKSSIVKNSESINQKRKKIVLHENCGEDKYKKAYAEEMEVEGGGGVGVGLEGGVGGGGEGPINDTSEAKETPDVDKVYYGQTGMVKGNVLFRCEIFKPENIKKYSNSCLISDSIISPHPRYVTLTKNIRLRRGAKVIGFSPVYKDKYTNSLSIWKDSLDPNDFRLFKKKKKKYILQEHLIWNKSMLNTKGSPAVKKEINGYEEKESERKIKEMVTEADINAMGDNALFDRVVRNSLFSNIDDDEEHVYIYDRKFIEEYSKKTQNPVKNYIYSDAMCFGMGLCCLQVTMSCSTINDAKYLYDQLAVIAPLFLALTAATPYVRGFLADTDTRWRSISNSVDCRTEEEMCYISKPRYSGISLYISNELPLKNNYYFYNDIDVVLDKYVYEKLRRENVDDFLARHISSLFVRDPLVVFEGAYNENDLEEIEKMRYKHAGQCNAEKTKREEVLDDSLTSLNTNYREKLKHAHTVFLEENFNFLEEYEESVLSSNQHFENFQSTSWNSVRFKPPPISDRCFTNKSSIGWRVEFRTPDIQITDFENACVVTLIIVLSKVIIEERLNLYIPMSLLEENLYRSSNRDAIIKEKFFFRDDLSYDTSNNEIKEKNIYDIFFNQKNGIFHICSNYVEKKYKEGVLNRIAKNKIDEYIEFIKLRCSGQISTDAAYLRNFILNHPSYNHDSFINSKINYDVCKLITDIGKGLIIPLELLGVFVDPYKERIKSDIKQINESQYLNSLAYRLISGEDCTQYLLLSEHINKEKNFKTETVDTIYEDSSDGYKLEFGKILYQFSA